MKMKKYKIVFLRGDLGNGGLGIVSAMQANYLYEKGFDITVLLDKPYSRELFESNGAKLYNKDIDIIPALTSSRYLNTGFQVDRRVKKKNWFGGFTSTYYDEYGKFVKKEWYDSDKRRVKIEIPIIEQFLSSLKEGDIVMAFQTSLMWYMGNLRLPHGVSTIAQIHIQVFFTNKWIDNVDKQTALVCLTPKTKEAYEDLYGKKENIKVIPNPLRFPIPGQIKSHKDRKLKIIFVGLLIERKQPFDAIKTFIKIKNVFNNATLCLYGEGPMESDIKDYIMKINLQDSITLHGYIPDVSTIYSDASLMLLPTKSEAFGMVVLEALSYGVPVLIYSSVFGVHELIDNGKDGYIFDQGDIKGMSEKAINLLKCADTRNKFAKHGRKKLDQYELDKVKKQWLALVKECSSIPISNLNLQYNLLQRMDLPQEMFNYIKSSFHDTDHLAEIIQLLNVANAKIIDGKPYIYSKDLIENYKIPLDKCQIN